MAFLISAVIVPYIIMVISYAVVSFILEENPQTPTTNQADTTVIDTNQETELSETTLKTGLIMLIVFFVSLLFSVIYIIYWFASTRGELMGLGASIPTTWLFVVPIASMYYMYKYFDESSSIVGGNMNGTTGLILTVVGLTPVAILIQQSNYNKFSGQPQNLATGINPFGQADQPASMQPLGPIQQPGATNQPGPINPSPTQQPGPMPQPPAQPTQGNYRNTDQPPPPPTYQV